MTAVSLPRVTGRQRHGTALPPPRPCGLHEKQTWSPAPELLPLVRTKLRLGAPHARGAQPTDQDAEQAKLAPDLTPTDGGVPRGGLASSRGSPGHNITPPDDETVQRVADPDTTTPPGLVEDEAPEPIEEQPPGTAEPGDTIPATAPVAAAPAAPAPGSSCPTNIKFSAGLRVAHFKDPAKLSIKTTPGPAGPVPAVEIQSPQFVMSAIASALGRRRDVQDWEFGFTQTQTMHRREFCWLNQRETKDALANYEGQIIDSLTVNDVPFARRADCKPAGFLRTMFFQDSPLRKVPFDVGGRASGDCLQSASIDWGFIARLVARKKGSGNQPMCPLLHAGWQTHVSIAPHHAAHGRNCPTSLGAANLTSSATIITKGTGQGPGPFETSTQGGHTANSIPEGNTLDLVPGPC